VICDLEQRLASGGDCTGEVQNLAFQGENPRSGLNWLCLAMLLDEGIVLRVRTFFRVQT
jgi:hypothetical protein